jgi:hypothetical protein
VIRRSAVTRVTIRQVRAAYKPSEFSRMPSVMLRFDGAAVEVNLAREAAPYCHGGQRVWLVCPRCSARVNTYGFVTAEPTINGCRGCLGWREPSRRRRRNKESIMETTIGETKDACCSCGGEVDIDYAKCPRCKRPFCRSCDAKNGQDRLAFMAMTRMHPPEDCRHRRRRAPVPPRSPVPMSPPGATEIHEPRARAGRWRRWARSAAAGCRSSR